MITQITLKQRFKHSSTKYQNHKLKSLHVTIPGSENINSEGFKMNIIYVIKKEKFSTAIIIRWTV